jgi:hypothetical protein
MARKAAGPESEFRLARGAVGPSNKDIAIIPVVKKRKGWLGKPTGVFVTARRTEPGARRGLFGGADYDVELHVGGTNAHGTRLRPAEGDPDLGTNKAGKAERAARTVATVWFEDHPKEADAAIREMIEDARPKNGAAGRRGR